MAFNTTALRHQRQAFFESSFFIRWRKHPLSSKSAQVVSGPIVARLRQPRETSLLISRLQAEPVEGTVRTIHRVFRNWFPPKLVSFVNHFDGLGGVTFGLSLIIDVWVVGMMYGWHLWERIGSARLTHEVSRTQGTWIDVPSRIRRVFVTPAQALGRIPSQGG